MKTIYTFLFALTISLSTICGQSLTSTPQGVGSSLKVELNNPFPNMTDKANELNFAGNEEFLNNTGNQLLSTKYTRNNVTDQSNSTIYLLDSLIYKDTTNTYQSKYEYSYDSKGHETLNISYTWDATNKILKNSSKAESTYDNNGLRTLYVTYTWDAVNNIWKLSNKYESTYDVNGNLTLYLTYKWDATNSIWINWNKNDNTYDSNGNKTLFISYLWDATNNVWNMTNKSESTYDSNGCTLILSYTYSTNIWNLGSKSEYTYNSNGHRILYVSSTWDATNNVWKGNSKTEYNYDSTGLQTSYASYTWDATNNIWKGSSKTEYTYDGNAYQTQNIIYSWDATNNIWKMITKYDNTYDGNGNKTQFYRWSYSTGTWVKNQIGNYYYSILINTSGVITPANIKINIYPNPAKSELRINGLEGPSRFTLSDINGKLIISRNIINNESISISSLSKGIYLVKLSNREGSFVSKLIKE